MQQCSSSLIFVHARTYLHAYNVYRRLCMLVHTRMHNVRVYVLPCQAAHVYLYRRRWDQAERNDQNISLSIKPCYHCNPQLVAEAYRSRNLGKSESEPKHERFQER